MKHFLVMNQPRGTINGAAVVFTHEPPPLSTSAAVTADGLPNSVSQQTDGLICVIDTQEVSHG